MTDFLYIAEKPSLAEAVAKAVGSINGVTPTKGNDVWKVGNDAVTWVRGHFYELWMPDDYDPRQKSWKVENFPFVPDKWKRKPREDERGWIPRQIKNIHALIKEAKNVVNVGDAGREGQLLIDEVLQELGYDPFASNMWRMWVNDMNDGAMILTVKGKFKNADKQNLFNAAFLRQKADWIHGLNLTGLYTSLAKNVGANMLVSVGRVQSPVLKLVRDRDIEIENFKPVKHFLPHVTFRHENGQFKADWIMPPDCPGVNANNQLVDKSVADAVAAKVQGKTGKVESYTSSSKSKAPPLTYSLATLQKACASKLGLTATQTLEVAQYLYDNKITTYPRSESEYLTNKMYAEDAPGMMSALASTPGLADLARGGNLKIKTKVWNDKKAEEHSGIVPSPEFQPQMLQRCNPTQRAVFDLIAKAFIANFYPDQTWKSLQAVVAVEGERFKATGRQITSQGWRVVFGAVEEDDEEDTDKEAEQSVPVMAKNDPVKAEGSGITFKETTPPPRFNDGTLIDAMIKIDRFVTDPKVKQRLKESSGLGTAATRNAIIETLLKRNFLSRPADLKGKIKTKVKTTDKTALISTETGRSIIDLLPETITSPGLTALWEDQLKKIEEGEASPEQFYDVLVKTIAKNVERAKETPVKIAGATIEQLPGSGDLCPACGKGHMRTRVIQKGDHKGKRFLSCDAYNKDDPTSCRHSIFPDSGPRQEIKPVEGHGRECPKCKKGHLVTRKSKTGSFFLSCDNWVKDKPELSCDYREFIEEKIPPLPGDGEVCEKCKKGRMVTKKFFSGDQKGERYLSCNGYRKEDPDSCRNAIFPQKSGGARTGTPAGGKSKYASKESSPSKAAAPQDPLRRSFKK